MTLGHRRVLYAGSIGLCAVLLAVLTAPEARRPDAPIPLALGFEPPLPPPERPPGDEPEWQVELRSRRLLVPVKGVAAEALADAFADPRGRRRHEAIDIMAPRHTPVVAVEDGRIARLFRSDAGGITVYQFDSAERYCYYYAHLDRYARGLGDGDTVERGQVLGYVGTSGNAPESAPHLHFAIFRLSEGKRWWEGEAVNPYLVLGPAGS